MRPRTATLLLAAFLLPGAPRPADAAARALVAAGDGVRIRVQKQGLLSAFAHDHDLEVTRWHGTVEVPDGDPAQAAAELVLDAGSLREREPGLSEGDRREIEERVAGPTVLDAARDPEIVFHVRGASLEPGAAGDAPRGTLHGELTLRGRARPVEVHFEAERTEGGWRVRGRARLLQSDFGIAPVRLLGGAVGVRDAVEVVFEVQIR